jgi:ubiquinone/menaquinone biosynthesis C-methylase UbiE
MSKPQPSIILQQKFWNHWNASTRENRIDRVSLEQADLAVSWLRAIGARDIDLIDVGCGAGWLCSRLTEFGRVVGTDLSDEVLARAARRCAGVEFVAGDIMALDFGARQFDAAISLEVLSHVADQPAFMGKIARMLKPGGQLIIATQNRPALMRNDIPPPQPGQLRRWVDRHELKALLRPHFELLELRSITPMFNRGFLRAVNSSKLQRLVAALKLEPVGKTVIRVQEKAWLGWTLVALARKI